MEVFKGVVRNHGTMDVAKSTGKRPKKGRKDDFHRYVIIGMLVSDEPIPEFEVKQAKKGKFDDSTFVLAGEVLMAGMSSLLCAIPRVEPKINLAGYTANEILTSLNEIA